MQSCDIKLSVAYSCMHKLCIVIGHTNIGHCNANKTKQLTLCCDQVEIRWGKKVVRAHQLVERTIFRRVVQYSLKNFKIMP